jgi:hypothetical protein
MTIKEALARASRTETGADLLPRLTTVLDQLQKNADLDHSARADLVSIIDDGLELAAAMLNASYPAELVLKRTTNILATSQRILMHTETARPGRHCFGAISASGQILPIMANTEEEAQAQLDTLVTMGLSRDSIVIPIRMSSQFVLQPREQPSNELPEPEAPVPFAIEAEQPSRADELAEALDRAAATSKPSAGSLFGSKE